VVGGPESVDIREERLRDSEGREVVYGVDDISVIVTGVPRAGRDDKHVAAIERAIERGDYETPNKPVPYQAPAETKVPPLPKLAPQPERPPEPRYIRTELRQPSDDPGDAGEIVEGYYDVKGWHPVPLGCARP